MTCKKRSNPVLKTYLGNQVKRSIRCEPKRGDLNRALMSRPLIRTRTKGLVGPEPDWSVVYSDLPMDIIYKLNPGDGRGNEAFYHGKMAVRPLEPNPYDRVGVVIERHNGMARTFLFDLEDILLWTSMAHAAGVTFNGNRGYSMPKKFAKNKLPDWLDSYNQYCMNFKIHERTPSSKYKRSCLRKIKRGMVTYPKTVPLENRKPTCREARRDWRREFSKGRTIPWSEYKKTLKSSIYMVYRDHVSRPSQVVISSLVKIYSKCEFTSDDPKFSWDKPAPFKAPPKPWIPGQHGKKVVEPQPSRREKLHLAPVSSFEDRTVLLSRLGMKFRMNGITQVHNILGGVSIHDTASRSSAEARTGTSQRW